MAKTNFAKVEESLKAGLEKMNVDQLGQLADIAQGAKRPELKSLMEKAAKVAAKTALERKATLYIMHKTLKEIDDPKFYAALGLSKESLQELIAKLPTLKKEEWDKLKKTKERILQLQREHRQTLPTQKDESLIESERKRHINKRFNVREKWLPMK